MKTSLRPHEFSREKLGLLWTKKTLWRLSLKQQDFQESVSRIDYLQNRELQFLATIKHHPIDHQQRTQVLAKIDHQQRTQVLTRIGQNMANPQALNRNPIYQESSNQQNITNKNPTHNSTTN